MWLVLCSVGDLPALWAYEGLRDRGLQPIELIGAESLSYSLGWEHRLEDGRISTGVRLADGRVIESDQIRGGLNRLMALSVGPWNQAQEDDREYALLEFGALYLSWLHHVPGTLLNRPSPSGLGGRHLHPLQWRLLASRAGFTTSPLRLSSSHPFPPVEPPHDPDQGEPRTVFVVSGRVVGDVEEAVGNACQRLATLSGIDLLGVYLRAGPDGSWSFQGAGADPDLRLGGGPLLDALHSALLDENSTDDRASRD